MKHTTSLPGKEEREFCVHCRGRMPVALLRIVSKRPLRFACTNQAACRKRQRQLEAQARKP